MKDNLAVIMVLKADAALQRNKMISPFGALRRERVSADWSF